MTHIVRGDDWAVKSSIVAWRQGKPGRTRTTHNRTA